MNIVGLGKAGCSVAEKFKNYPQYKVYKINVGIRKEKGVYALKHQSTPEAYERNFPNLRRTFLKEVMGNVLFITSCGATSGASLRIIEQLRANKCSVSVLYIKPDPVSLSKEKRLIDNLVFNVFQEYARSAVFERLYVIDNYKMSEIVGDVPVREYFNQINELISSTVHMINVFDNQNSVMDTFPNRPGSTARVSTYGLVEYDTGEEKLFFDLEMAREKKYYYAIPEEILDSDGTVVKNIKKHIKNNLEHDKMNSSYAIHSTTYDKSYVYCVSSSTLIQKNKNNT